jgi:hypothetical protein
MSAAVKCMLMAGIGCILATMIACRHHVPSFAAGSSKALIISAVGLEVFTHR